MFQIDRAILFLSIDHVIRVGDYIGVVVLPAGAGIHVSDVAECYGNHLRVQWNLERIGDRAGQSRLELGVALGVAGGCCACMGVGSVTVLFFLLDDHTVVQPVLVIFYDLYGHIEFACDEVRVRTVHALGYRVLMRVDETQGGI